MSSFACLWKVTFAITDEQIMDISEQTKDYECGGRNCQSHAVHQIVPAAGRKYPVRLVDDQCRGQP
jgi:hypothetical protein